MLVLHAPEEKFLLDQGCILQCMKSFSLLTAVSYVVEVRHVGISKCLIRLKIVEFGGLSNIVKSSLCSSSHSHIIHAM